MTTYRRDAITVLVELLPDHPYYDAPRAADLAPARAGDAGLDLVACESVRLAPGQRAAVSAGMRIALPEGVEAQVRPRSGRALAEGLTVVNAPGTIDPGYRGPVKVLLLNAAAAIDSADLEPAERGAGAGPDDAAVLVSRLRAGLEARTVRIERGERIAQLVFARFERPKIVLVEEVSTATERGEAGFGSTGVRV